jgi:hypothetical protein
MNSGMKISMVSILPLTAQIPIFDFQSFLENTAPPVIALGAVVLVAWWALRHAGRISEKQTDLTAQLIKENGERERRRDAEVATDRAVTAEREKRRDVLLQTEQGVAVRVLPPLTKAVQEANKIAERVLDERKEEVAAQLAQAEAAKEQNALMSDAVREMRSIVDQLRLWRAEDLQGRQNDQRKPTGTLPPETAANATSSVEVKIEGE